MFTNRLGRDSRSSIFGVNPTAGGLLACLLFGTLLPAAVNSGIDFRLWSPQRIQAFRVSLTEHFDPPLALLDIPRIHLKVPVFNGTNETILDRGVGRILGTATVGGTGNLGIAGHRDGFFRALKYLKKGDIVELRALVAVFVYQVDDISIVTPGDVRILENRSVPTITLVTCYPFYFVGDAPQRYILRCSLKRTSIPMPRGRTKPSGQTASGGTNVDAGALMPVLK